MSQLADLKEVVNCTPLSPLEQGKLLLAILGALEWEVDGVETAEDAQVFLES